MIDFIEKHQNYQQGADLNHLQRPSGQQQASLLAMYQQQQQQQQQQLNQSAQQQQSGNELIGYYFGSISRETAEWILKTHGNQTDGAYLLRSSGPNDDFVLSLMVVVKQQQQQAANAKANCAPANHCEVLHYKIVETDDSFVALHGQVGDEKFATIDELIDKAQGVATKPRWPIHRQTLEAQILPPTYWGLTVDQVRLAILIKAKQWGFPLLSSLLQAPQQQQQLELLQSGAFSAVPAKPNQMLEDNPETIATTTTAAVTTLNNETIRTLIYKSLHEFQPWFHGKISREEAEKRIEERQARDGRFLVRERDNYSYAMCISHKRTTKHYRIDVLPTGELAIQDGRRFTSLMALVSHYTIMSDGLWCALTEACSRPIQAGAGLLAPLQAAQSGHLNWPTAQANLNSLNGNSNGNTNRSQQQQQQNLYCSPPSNGHLQQLMPTTGSLQLADGATGSDKSELGMQDNAQPKQQTSASLICAHQSGVASIKAPIREWLQTINLKWSQLMAAKSQHHSLNSFLFGNQNPLNNHCGHRQQGHHRSHRQHNGNSHNSSISGNHHQRQHNAYRHGSQNKSLPANTHHHGQHQCRRKCKNEQASACCSRFQQQLQLQPYPATAMPMMMANSTLNQRQTPVQGSGTQPNNFFQPINGGAQQPVAANRSANCCQIVATSNALESTLQNGLTAEQTDATQASGLLLSHLPQNSGFTLNSQSFIGSPLFAVQQQQQQQAALQAAAAERISCQSGSGSGSGASNSKNNVEVAPESEKLISPAQSISARLNEAPAGNSARQSNNPYALNTADIYGSQTSTALVNDRFACASSSSSSGNQRPINSNDLYATSGQVYKQPAHCGQGAQQQHILCGQHAGPAYRYTNCQDENSFKPCLHRPYLTRAADDSQLPATPSTHLAAMAKFVQFQDGQCLRTHRDARSIQMAYLSAASARQQYNNGSNINGHQVPPRLQTCRSSQRQIIGGGSSNNKSNNNATQFCFSKNNAINNFATQQQCNATYLNNTLQSDASNRFQGQANGDRQDRQTNQRRSSAAQLPPTATNNISANNGSQLPSRSPLKGIEDAEMDLMDLCDGNELDDGFRFRYDPKLIKSSSIETLCGIATGDDYKGHEQSANDQDDCLLAQFKSNAELVMSLQSAACWQQPPILNPTLPAATLEPEELLPNNHLQLGDETQAGAETRAPDSVFTGCGGADFMGSGAESEQLASMKKKHDLDELTTALLAELTASLKAQVDLKNKRSGLVGGLHICEKSDSSSATANGDHHQGASTGNKQQTSADEFAANAEFNPTLPTNPLELMYEFDTLMIANNK